MAFSPVALKSRISGRFSLLKWSSWYLFALKLAMGSLLILLIALFAVLYESDAEERRATLIADVLWLEQSVNFHIEGHAELLQQLSAELADERGGRDLFRARSQYLLNNNPDIQQVLWFDTIGNVREKAPAIMLPRLGGEAADGDTQNQALEMARRLGKLTYSDAYTTPAGAQFEMYMPVLVEGRYRGAIVVVYSFNALLKALVPWWFAEKYQIRIQDSNGTVLASKSKVIDADTTISYSIPFDPPGYGMVLRVDAYRGSSSFVERVLITLVIGLASSVLVSLWAMRGQIRRRIAAEQAHRAEYAFRKAMEESLTVGMRARDLDGRVTYVNPAFCHMVGWRPEELVGRVPPMPYWVPELLDETLLMHHKVLAGDAPRDGFEIQFRRRDGDTFWALVYEAPLIDAQGKHTGWMASVVDITERKAAEELAHQQQEKLQRTSRLITMGEMASTLAHELNQPLSAIASYATGCLNRLGADNFTPQELQPPLSKLVVQAQRAGQIIRRVHDFVRKSEPRVQVCSLPQVLADAISFVDPDAKKHGVTVILDKQVPEALVDGDHVMLEQVVLNLTRNGVEAMVGLPSKLRRLEVTLSAQGDNALVSVRDHGAGIAPEVRENLFQPFFTTEDEGMGMGLNICRSIIEFHRGRLWFEPHPQGGSVFVFSLPLRSAA